MVNNLKHGQFVKRMLFKVNRCFYIFGMYIKSVFPSSLKTTLNIYKYYISY